MVFVRFWQNLRNWNVDSIMWVVWFIECQMDEIGSMFLNLIVFSLSKK